MSNNLKACPACGTLRPNNRRALAIRPAADESAKPYYLIERQGSLPTVWWKGPVWADMTPDATKAYRFASRAEAEAKARLWTDHSLFVSEHMDIAGVSSNGMEQAFSSSAMSRRDELEMPGGTQYLDRFIDAMGLLCRSKPPREMCEQWLKHESEELQEFAINNARIYWMQGIGAIDAAQVLADNPEEGEGHEGYTSDYSRSGDSEPATVASKEAVTLSDDWIELYALRHIAPHAGRFKAAFGVDVPYQQTEQFRRVKSYTEDVVRAALAQRDASKGEPTS